MIRPRPLLGTRPPGTPVGVLEPDQMPSPPDHLTISIGPALQRLGLNTSPLHGHFSVAEVLLSLSPHQGRWGWPRSPSCRPLPCAQLAGRGLRQLRGEDLRGHAPVPPGALGVHGRLQGSAAPTRPPLPSPGGGVAACGPRGVTQTQCFDIRTLFQTNLVS